jgi:N-acetyl-gamma-glutamyl-phosphate reductase
MKIRAGVVGVSGYSGLELLRLMARHPFMECVAAMDAEEIGERPLEEIHPSLRGLYCLATFPPKKERIEALGIDTVFLCTPDKVSHALVPELLALGLRVIDFSGAFRLKDAAAYPSWYGFQHAHPAFLDLAVYGLPEWNAGAIASAKLIANPGCYPTSVLLALRPLIQSGLLQAGSDIFCDSKSGVTGAGRSVRQEMMFSEVSDSFRPYSPITHRHVPEICQELGWDLKAFTFVPHLLPINRGILSTMYVRFHRQVRSDELAAEYQKGYSGRRFVRILGDSRLPELRAVNHTNFCDIGWRLTHGGMGAIVFSAIDNLVKGASGQAVQNFNIMHALDESAGLP